MFITHNGALYDEDNYGNEPLGKLRVRVVNTCTLNITSVSEITNLSVAVQTECNLNTGTAIALSGLTVSVTTLASLKTEIERGAPGTAKLSSYTILPAISTHTESANDNLPTQFKDCPNIVDLISFPLQELDKAQTDIYDFQSKILNIEEAEGVNLELCGSIVGRDKVTGQDDGQYRSKVIGQVYINNNDGTIPKLLTTLLIIFNLQPDYNSYDEIQLQRTCFNTLELFVRDFSAVGANSSRKEIESLMPAGARVEICVLDRDSTPGRVFRASGYMDQPESESSTITKGLGSLYDDTVGGSCTGLYNYEIYYQLPGEYTGEALRVTNKTIPVETF